MEMEPCNFDNFSRAEQLKLCKQKGLKADNSAIKLDLQVALMAFEQVQRRHTSSQEDEVDDNEEEEEQTEDEEREDPTKGLEQPEGPNASPAEDQDAMDAQDGARSNVSARA
ncbi:hypothetical protein NDU88_007474 [Pleurodeles waltl]|uniref:Uncharacterized protein n=1 Tax=Pleurodeles waltl TaxID=8319 RepID=A0AAV7NT61_PLEWA|nr:hypothetical protein NDU88_007474 [Pleurodeles waltl]